ncbi:MAG: NAD-dependent alcohol dehydrogenase [Hadesarchaea archaeon]|nr:MAG: NAD-dependent alcohol dehydrogenase [Hadesarchaea archaeon]
MWWFLAPRVAFGEDALDALETVKGNRAMVVTDQNIKKLGFVEEIVQRLKKNGMEVLVFDEVEPEPSKETVMRGAELAREFSPDWFVGLGGGSCMDAAKAIWVMYERPDLRIEDITPMTELGLRKKARLVCIPTTSGTGSDATWAAVITSREEEFKVELASREILPDLSIVDPKLASKMSPSLTASTGMDVLAHAFEAYLSQWNNPFSDALALKAIQLAFTYLPRAYANGNDMEARDKMHVAATMAGMAFSNSQIGLIHAMGHSLGAVFHIPHGRTVGLFLPYGLEYAFGTVKGRLAELAWAAGIRAGTEEEAAERLLEEVRNLIRRLGEPLSIGELGIKREEFESRLEELVRKAMQSTGIFTSPRVPDEADCRKLFLYAYEGKRVDF